jgi:two-component system alkaline phosphatase synthesis response regulator PhoP
MHESEGHFESKSMTKVLVVDDEPAILKLVEVSLSRQGYEVISAANGVEALAKVEEESPTLILMDAMMPYMDGFEALKRLKENPVTQDIPVIMLTAKRHDADLIRSLQSGAACYITKPFNPTELITMVERTLNDHKNEASR